MGSTNFVFCLLVFLVIDSPLLVLPLERFYYLSDAAALIPPLKECEEGNRPKTFSSLSGSRTPPLVL